MSDFFRFPSTPYLLAPPDLDVRADKVLTDTERADLLARTLRVEEKLDGENLGLSYEDGELRLQARGSYVQPGGRRFRGIESWLRPRHQRLVRAIEDELILFGEWCAVQHSVRYDALPDWFVLFDVYDRSRREFWPTELRDELAGDLGLSVVPILAVGHFDEQALLDLIGTSRYGAELMEGIVARAAEDDALVPRAKLVRPDFVQGIGDHWLSTSRPLNRLASPA